MKKQNQISKLKLKKLAISKLGLNTIKGGGTIGCPQAQTRIVPGCTHK